MHRAIPAVLITAAVFVLVWEFQPTPSTPAVAAGVPTSQGGNLTVPGTAEATRWGTVQVQAVFSGGKLSDVQMLQTPRDRHATRAIPILRQEALRAQSADIDTVTGATATSEAYTRSLQAAVDARGN